MWRLTSVLDGPESYDGPFQNWGFYYLTMSINQLKFDKYILVSIKNQLGVGSVYEYPDRVTADFIIQWLSKIQHLILPFFVRYPLVGYKNVKNG